MEKKSVSNGFSSVEIWEFLADKKNYAIFCNELGDANQPLPVFSVDDSKGEFKQLRQKGCSEMIALSHSIIDCRRQNNFSYFGEDKRIARVFLNLLLPFIYVEFFSKTGYKNHDHRKFNIRGNCCKNSYN